MRVEDIVLVYENRKGSESKLLLTKKDYVDAFLSGIYSTDASGLAESLWDLEETRESRSLVKEEYIRANYSIQARFCADREQLREFLAEKTVTTKEWIPLNVTQSSGECYRMMYSLGLDEFGTNAHIRYKYEPVDMRFGVGGIVHNLNGSDYRIMETYSQSNLLLQDNRTGNFMVAIGTKGYVRYPNMEGYGINDAVYGVEWEHGIYLNTSRPSEVDFTALKEKYGQEGMYREAEAKYGYQKDGREHSYEVVVAEMFQATVTVEAVSLADAVGKAEAMYENDEINLGFTAGPSIRPAMWPDINLALRAAEQERQAQENVPDIQPVNPDSTLHREAVSISDKTINSQEAEDASLPVWQPLSQPESDLYLRDWEYANKLGEAGDYMDSFRKNIRCKEALEDALRDGYVDGKLRYNIAVPLADKFGADRVHLVLVNSVGLLWSCGGISRENRDWADNEYRMMSDKYRDSFVLRDDTNDFIIRPSAMPFCTSAVNAFTDQFRILLEKEKPELAAGAQKEAAPEQEQNSNLMQKASRQNKPQQKSPKL